MRLVSASLLSFSFLILSLLPASLCALSSRTALARAGIHATSARAYRSGLESTTSQEITKANWQQHPKIKAVRAVVAAVDADLTKGLYKVSKRMFDYCEPYEDTLRALAADSEGRARRYEKEAGSEDSSLAWKHYYDAGGHLRFVFITGGATNGSELEHRIYFDEEGKRIWEDQKYVKGPGYTFPKVWPDADLQLVDPAKAFAAASPCPEIKSRDERRNAVKPVSPGASSRLDARRPDAFAEICVRRIASWRWTG